LIGEASVASAIPRFFSILKLAAGALPDEKHNVAGFRTVPPDIAYDD
jgi:hypothetical protein